MRVPAQQQFRQANDYSFCQAICAELDDEKQQDFYLDKEGVPYKTVDGRDLLVIPTKILKKVLHDFHDLSYAGHLGQTKTLVLISS